MSSMRRWLVIAALGCAGLASAPAARAQSAADVEVMFEARAPKTGADTPQIEATVIGAPSLAVEKFVLVDESARPPVQIPAASRRAFNQGSQTLAVAIVMLGWEMWIGNDTYRPKSDPTRATGALLPLQAALSKLDLKAAGPPGSVGMVITYADRATIRVPLGPLGDLTGRSLGTQKDYGGMAGMELVKGVELALAELRKSAHPIKMLIVIGDGNDVDNDAAKAQLAVLRKQAQADRVRMFGIVYKAELSLPSTVLTQLTPQVSTVPTADKLGAALKTAFERVADRQYLTFPIAAKDGKAALAWDGKQHELVLQIDGQKTDSQPVTLAPKWQPPAAPPAAPKQPSPAAPKQQPAAPKQPSPAAPKQ
jgi:hypothetical protein